MKKLTNYLFILAFLSVFHSQYSFSHCDTQDGPVVADAVKAIEHNNVNHALKWVLPEYEKELIDAFVLTMKVRVLGSEAKELSDNYFFETLVRLHRTGEGVPYTGLKPSGTPIDEKILAADRSIELGDLAPLEKLVPPGDMAELRLRFEKVMSLKNFDINDVSSGRSYVEAYVQFFHFAEGEPEQHNGHRQGKEH
jgi:Family of unknown function (DUF6448)